MASNLRVDVFIITVGSGEVATSDFDLDWIVQALNFYNMVLDLFKPHLEFRSRDRPSLYIMWIACASRLIISLTQLMFTIRRVVPKGTAGLVPKLPNFPNVGRVVVGLLFELRCHCIPCLFCH